MIDIKSLIATLTSTTVLMVILGFIAKSIIEQLLSRDITSYKANLDMEKEKFVSEIQKSAFQCFSRDKSDGLPNYIQILIQSLSTSYAR